MGRNCLSAICRDVHFVSREGELGKKHKTAVKEAASLTAVCLSYIGFNGR
jgi:hypothetical protein